MSSVAASWSTMARANPVVGFIDIALRGAGQVMFQNNPLTGLLFIIGITWGAVAADMPQVAIGSVLGLIVATGMAWLLRVDADSRGMGLYGFNGILVGAALPTFLDVEPMLWAYVIVGAAVSTVAMLAIANVMKTWEVPALTFPFVLTTWLLLLAAYAFSSTPIASMGPPAVPAEITPGAAAATIDVQMLADSFFGGISQVFLIDNVITGLIFIVALAVSSVWSAVFGMVGAGVSLLVALALGADAGNISAGLFGFSAVLTGIALGSVFYQPGLRVFLYALLGIIFTVVAQGALDTALTPIGIPTLTAPFVIVTWLFLLPKENLAPVPHNTLAGGAAGGSTKS
jgi:urea transporter